MLALAAWRDARCHRCGGDLHETTDDANSGELDATGKYVALSPLRCYRCTALSMSEDKFNKKNAYHPHALIHRVELQPRRPRRPPAK
ncbi:MAG TPA: hypothetical protein VF062_28230 [Candidatus Limnocylindrales bacterium]